MMFDMRLPPGPTLETGNSFPYTNSVKFEEGDQRASFSDMSEQYPWSQGSPNSITNYPTPQMNPFMAHEMQQGMAYPALPSGFPSGFHSISSNPQWFYSPLGMPQDSTMQDLPISLSDYNIYNPVDSWESNTMNQPEALPDIKQDDRLIEVKSEPKIPIKVGMPQGITMQELTTSLPNANYNPVTSWELTTKTQSRPTPAEVEVRENIQPPQVRTEPDVPIKIETYQLE